MGLYTSKIPRKRTKEINSKIKPEFSGKRGHKTRKTISHKKWYAEFFTTGFLVQLLGVCSLFVLSFLFFSTLNSTTPVKAKDSSKGVRILTNFYQQNSNVNANLTTSTQAFQPYPALVAAQNTQPSTETLAQASPTEQKDTKDTATTAAKEPKEIKPEVKKTATKPKRTYTIKKGDTLNSIAINNKTTTKKILELNPQVNSKSLKIGQVLVLS